MDTSRKIVKVFLASPGDLAAERSAAKYVVDSFNREWAEHLGLQVELVGWEDTVSRFGRPQEIINRDLDQCELFIGMMWKHWGSSPSTDGPFTSGFEEEFERAVDSRKKQNKPEISLFLKEIDPEQIKDPGEKLQKVLAFRERIISRKEVLFQPFNGLRDFEEKIRRCVADYVQGLTREEAKKSFDELQTRSPDNTKNSEKNVSGEVSPFGREGLAFLREIVARSESDKSYGPVSAVDTARLRLNASLIGAPGNDERSLGVHDTNIIYAHHDALSLSWREKNGLLDAGLEHFSDQNVPLWHWYVATSAEEFGLLSSTAIFGPLNKQIGALSAMQLVGESLRAKANAPTPGFEFTRNNFLNAWFSDRSDNRLKRAALDYLSVCGCREDLPRIKLEFERGNYQTVGAATNAIIRLNLKDSREAAIRTLYELQPESVDASLIADIFENATSVDSILLVAGVNHRSNTVRKAIVQLLADRNALNTEIAEQLLTDSEAAIRFNALRALKELGREFSDEKARSILIKPKSQPGPLGGFLSYVTDTEGEELFERYLRERFRQMPDAALEKYELEHDVTDRSARFALDYRYFDARVTALRAAVEDEYRIVFALTLKQIETRFGIDSVVYKKAAESEESTRRKLTRQGLNLICEKGSARDLSTVRRVLKIGYIEHSNLHLDFLKRFGEWQDIDLLISLVGRSKKGPGLLAFSFDREAAFQVAGVMAHIGRGRLAELVVYKMPENVLALVLLNTEDKEIATLTNEQLLELLKSSADDVRRIASLRAIRVFSKARIAELVRTYTQHDLYRFYNVIHWLDLGASMREDQVRTAASRALAKELAQVQAK